jgi:hypothetical protein
MHDWRGFEGGNHARGSFFMNFCILPWKLTDVFCKKPGPERDWFSSRSLARNWARPPYHLVILLKLYVYSYFNRINSSRLLEKESNRNVEVIWMTDKLAPDFKAIANFCRDSRYSSTCIMILMDTNSRIWQANKAALDMNANMVGKAYN